MDNNKLDSFKKAAIGMGYDPNEVEGFTNMVKTINPQREPVIIDGKTIDTQGLTPFQVETMKQKQSGLESEADAIANGYISSSKASDPAVYQILKQKYPNFKISSASEDPMVDINKQGGSKFLKGLPVTLAKAKAQAIMDMGGVDAWRNQAGIDDLLENNKTDLAKYKSAESFKQDLSLIQSLFANQNGANYGLSGLSGPVTKIIAGSPLEGFRSTEQKQAATILSQMATTKIKELSGVAVSPKEFERMRGWLPDLSDQENTVQAKTDALLRGINMNQEVIEQAARQGVTPSQYLDKNKPELYMKYGFLPNGNDPKLGGSKESLSSSPNLRRDQTIQKLKGAGYSQDKIDSYLKAKGL